MPDSFASPRRRATWTAAAELVATVLTVDVAPGDHVDAGTTLCLLESMKMEIPVLSDRAGTVLEVRVAPGETVSEGDELVVLAD